MRLFNIIYFLIVGMITILIIRFIFGPSISLIPAVYLGVGIGFYLQHRFPINFICMFNSRHNIGITACGRPQRLPCKNCSGNGQELNNSNKNWLFNYFNIHSNAFLFRYIRVFLWVIDRYIDKFIWHEKAQFKFKDQYYIWLERYDEHSYDKPWFLGWIGLCLYLLAGLYIVVFFIILVVLVSPFLPFGLGLF